jgi:hypothetical protein
MSATPLTPVPFHGILGVKFTLSGNSEILQPFVWQAERSWTLVRSIFYPANLVLYLHYYERVMKMMLVYRNKKEKKETRQPYV